MSQSWEFSRQVVIDRNGKPYVGTKAYFFDAQTTTPRTAYADASLSTPHTHPVVADGYGRFPRVFLDTGSYRERVETSVGVVLWDDDGLTVQGTVEGGGDELEAAEKYTTGDTKWRFSPEALAGFVRLNGRTIGSSTSGGTERANDDAEALFTHLWNSVASLSLSGGRGASASGDWAANKALTLPDLRNRSPIGLDGMGNTALGDLSDTPGATGGSATVTLNIGDIPAHSHGGSTSTNGSHQHIYTRAVSQTSAREGVEGITETGYGSDESDSTSSAGNHNHSITSEGGGGAHENMPPYIQVTWYIKL